MRINRQIISYEIYLTRWKEKLRDNSSLNPPIGREELNKETGKLLLLSGPADGFIPPAINIPVIYYPADNIHCVLEKPDSRRVSVLRDNPESILFVAYLLSRFPFLETPQRLPVTESQEDISAIPPSALKILMEAILLGRKPSAAFLFLRQSGLLDGILPELSATYGMEQNKFHLYDVFHHLLASLDAVETASLELRWSALLHDIGKVKTRRPKKNGEFSFYNHEIESARMTPAILERFGVEETLAEKILFLVRNHMFHYTDDWTDRAIRRFMKNIPQENMKDLILLRLADRRGSGKRNYFPPAIRRLLEHIDTVQKKDSAFKVTDLEINGHDLMEAGIPAGREMGVILSHLKTLVESGRLENNREVLLREAGSLFHR